MAHLPSDEFVQKTSLFFKFFCFFCILPNSMKKRFCFLLSFSKKTYPEWKMEQIYLWRVHYLLTSFWLLTVKVLLCCSLTIYQRYIDWGFQMSYYLKSGAKKTGHAQKLAINKRSTIFVLSSWNLVKIITSWVNHFHQVSWG